MTIVAWDGRTLAADKRSVNQGLVSTVTKVRRIGDLLCAGSGDFASVLEMFAWIEKGRVASEMPTAQRNKDEWSAMLVIEGGRILMYERGAIPIHYEVPFYAIGGGRDYAIAAMHCGKTAREAVEIASIYECGCGNGIDAITLD